MKKVLIFAIVFCLALSTFALADKTKMKAKVGDELYVCACGEGCPCDTMSRNPGQCACGKDLVKTKVTVGTRPHLPTKRRTVSACSLIGISQLFFGLLSRCCSLRGDLLPLPFPFNCWVRLTLKLVIS